MEYLRVNLICDTSRAGFKTNTKKGVQKLFEKYGGQFYRSIELNEIDRKKLIDEDGFVYFDDCKLALTKLSSHIMHQVLTHFCKTKLFYGFYLSVAQEDFELDLLSSLAEKPHHKFKLKEESAYFSLGTMVNMCTFVPHFISSQNEKSRKICRDVVVEFEHDKKELSVYFRVKKSEKSSIRYKIEILYDNITSFIFSPNDECISVYVAVLFPPNLYTELEDNFEERILHCECTSGEDIWIRTNSFPGIESEVFGKCNVLKFQIPIIKNQEKIKSHVVIDCPWSLIKCLPKFVETPLYFAFIKNEQQIHSKDIKIYWNKECKLDETKKFDLCWALDCIQSHSFQFVDELHYSSKKTLFNKTFTKFADEDAAALETALYLVLNHLQKSHLLNIFDSLQILFVKLQSESINDAKSSNKKKKRKENLYKNMVNFRRVVMTPTRIVFLPNQPFKQTLFCHGPPENANENDDTCTLYRADYTIRAVIRNDDFELLPFTLNHKAIPGLQKLRDWEKENSISFKNRMQLEKLESKDKLANEIQDNFLNKCIKDRIKGLKIQNRTYEYLGSSTSQLRNYGLYLYARDCKNETASDIRKSLGNINERNVAKFVARVGLALSEVQYFIDLSEFEKNGSRIVRMIPDIKGGPNQEYIFSDGVGMISLTLATKIYEKLKHTRLMVNLEGPPSAFQIRLGGCKGLLVINPHLEGHQILIREESMRKYDSENMSLLGILKVSGISSVHLNRPFVTLLDQLGADRNYMCELLSENLKQLSKAFVTEGKAKNIILDHSNLHHEIDISLLAYAGITFLNEPFFRECLEAIITNNVRYLREKARIKIPREYGRTMFGVLDDINVYNENQLSNKSETQRFFLRENQVFIQISDANNPKEKKVITGPVMVTKFPCMHPGDIRIFEAFDIPELHHIVDCIVFPAVGKRPLPDQMAGSDLDGDEYAVVWNSKLFTFKNCKAMDYSPAKDVSSRNPLYLDRDVEVSDMIEFYNYYIKNYSVGRIASAHLAWADSKENGIFDPICINLAKKYAVSLDFAKTGINEILAQDEIVPAYPDFMEKHAIKNFYMSKRILGDLYRQIRLVELGLVEDLPVHSKTFCNQLLVHKDWKRYEDSAESAYQKYASLMKNLQNQFKIDSESALILGFPDKWSKLCISCEKTRELGYKVQQLVKNLFSIIRQDFEEEFDENKARDFREEKLAKASAYYMVTFHSKTKIKYFGLPWIFSKYLSQLGISKRGDVNRRFNEKELTIMLMNAIDEHCKCDSEDDIIQSVQHLFDNWISSQQVINFGLHISKQLIKTEINKQIDLHWHLFINSGETNSPGKFVLKILSKFAKRVIYLDKKYSKDSTNEDSKEINGTHKFLGIYSFITLNKMYRTKSVDCFIVNYVPFQQNISFMRYCLSFAHKRELKDFIAKNEDKFKKVLMQISVVECAFGRWFEDGNYYSYYLTAFGSKCAIETLNIVVAKFLNEPELIKLLYH